MTAIVVGLGLAVGLLGVLVAGLLRSHAEILRALHELGVRPEEAAAGSRRVRTVDGVPEPRSDSGELGPAVDVVGRIPGGGTARVSVDGAAHSTLLAFLSTGCATCSGFWEALGNEEQRRLPGADTRVVIVTPGPEGESEAEVAALAPADVTTVMSSEAWDDYGVPVSPYFLLVDGPAGRVVGEGAAMSWGQVVDLLGRSLRDATSPATHTRREVFRGRGRAARADRALAASGIEPNDPRLFHDAGESEAGP